MSGPCASIITKNNISEINLVNLKNLINQTSTEAKGNDFWVNERPFIIDYTRRHNEFPDYIENGFVELTGWEPGDMISLCAMCNDQVDHKILADLCINILTILEGVIDFGGPLDIDDNNIAGILYKLSYRTVYGTISWSHIGDISFLKHWKDCQNFKMIK